MINLIRSPVPQAIAPQVLSHDAGNPDWLALWNRINPSTHFQSHQELF